MTDAVSASETIMSANKTGGRAVKKQIRNLLEADNPENAWETLSRIPARRSINPLFGLLHSKEEIIRWRAITAMGKVVAALADEDIESARVIMRRLLWNMNEESGGIGWGSPEAMGAIMARHVRLADEYASILVSYVASEENFVEFAMLQRGVLWGIGRLGLARPELVRDCQHVLPDFMMATDAVLRGLAAWIAGIIHAPALREPLSVLATDETRFSFYLHGRLFPVSVGRMAREALLQLPA